jgi:hypothetical protein
VIFNQKFFSQKIDVLEKKLVEEIGKLTKNVMHFARHQAGFFKFSGIVYFCRLLGFK